jgi:hypothetical protein
MAYAAAIGSWESQPQEAADCSARHLSGSARRSAITVAAQYWARENPQDAAAWALKKATQPAGLIAIQEVMTFWANSDPQAGAAWAAGQPGCVFRDAALAWS